MYGSIDSDCFFRNLDNSDTYRFLETDGKYRIVIDNGMAETGRIYNLNGQYMGDNASKDNLPKGLYIMNGKKFIVR